MILEFFLPFDCDLHSLVARPSRRPNRARAMLVFSMATISSNIVMVVNE